MTRRWDPDVADEAVTAIARTPRLLIALDFDGTASELVTDPMAARAVPAVSDAIARLSALPDTTVAFVSGRSLVHLRETATHLAASHMLDTCRHDTWTATERPVAEDGAPRA